MGLTNEDREALEAVVPWSPTALTEVTAAVEQIVARHVAEARAAALNEAADAIDETVRDWEPWSDGRNRTPEVMGAVAAFRERSMDVRNLAAQPPP